MVKFNTIQDMVSAFYGPRGSEFVANAVQKADAPILSSTTGFYNRVFGAEAWALLNNQANTFGVIPKEPLNHTGFRVITARAASLGNGGIAENAALPDTIKPTLATANITLKTVAHNFDMSLVQELLDKGDDDTVGFEFVREYMAGEHAAHINKMLHGDVGTLAGNNVESIDRVCSSQSEESALLDAGDADIYGFDRSASTAFDAYVDHNSGTDRALTLDMLRTAIDTITENSGERPNVIVTGFDTGRDIDALFESQTRYLVERVKLGLNGIESAAGNDTGIAVSAVYGIPVIRDKDVTKDTVSRVYFLNTKYLFMGVKMPTAYFESNDFFAINKLGREGMYLTIGELVCLRLNAQGKIRDLS